MMAKKSVISPFENESKSLGIGGLTIENRTDRVSVYGSIDITRDKDGLANAEELKALLDAIVSRLRGEQLPDKISIIPTDEVPNPFSNS